MKKWDYSCVLNDEQVRNLVHSRFQDYLFALFFRLLFQRDFLDECVGFMVAEIC